MVFPFKLLRPSDVKFSAGLTSRYLDNMIVQGQGLTFLAPKTLAPIAEDESDFIYTVQAGEENRLDIISWKLYNTAELWWVLALCNDIIDPFTAPNPGDELRCPTVHRIYNNIVGRI